MSTKIEWTQETINPIIGCSKISEGCQNCYAETMANRLASMKTTEYYRQVTCKHTHSLPNGWNGKTYFVESQLDKPYKRKKPTMYFVCSMGDLFHESVPFEWIDKVFRVMIDNKHHTFQILTKRPERMKEYIKSLWDQEFSNIWLGVTAENQEQANKRIPILLETPASKRFVSLEPLLSNIDFIINEGNIKHYALEGNATCKGEMYSGGNKIDWVIAGPETGHKARPMQKEWIENIYVQCKTAKVPFFDKKNTLGLNLTQTPE